MRGISTPRWVDMLPASTRKSVSLALEFYATDAYLDFFRPRSPYSDVRDKVQKAITLPDEAAIEALYEIADSFPYSWPTEDHPNHGFCMDMLNTVDWDEVLRRLRLEVKNV